MTLKSIILAAFALLASMTCVQAAEWDVVSEQSHIKFSGTHAGNNFEGGFEKWTANIKFDPNALDQSEVVVRIDLQSALTGNKTYDGSLPTADWLDVKSNATAVFRTTDIRLSNSGGDYIANGLLSLRDKEIPVELQFDLKIKDDVATMTGKTTIARLDFGVGVNSDPSGSWVSLQIPIDIKVVARKS